jgi:transcriptional regulator with XRE-family HTH domain
MSAARAPYSAEHVGRRVLLLQKMLGYRNGREFAGFLEVDENTLTSWTRGKRVPGLDKILRLKEKTGVTADFILFGDTATLPLHLFRLLGNQQAVNN